MKATEPPSRIHRVHAFGLGFVALAVVLELGPYHWVPGLLWVLLPAAFVGVGVPALVRSTEPADVVGAGVAALSGPLCYAVLNHSYPDDSIGRGMMLMLMLFVLPINIAIGTRVGQRVGRWNPGTADVVYAAFGPGKTRLLAGAAGLGAVGMAAVILVRAHVEGSADPLDPSWELLYHGILPAVPIAMVGISMVALPTRLLAMCGALVGTGTAVLCSSLVVDPDPRYPGKVPLVFLSYLTLPITVGVCVLLADRLDRRFRE